MVQSRDLKITKGHMLKSYRRLIIAAALVAFLPPRCIIGEDSAKPPALLTDTDSCRYGCCFNRAIYLNGETLSLRGVSTFRYWGFRVYTAALYAPSSVKSRGILLGDTIKKLVLCYHRSLDPEQFREKSQEVLDDTPGLKLDTLEPHLSAMNAAYIGVREGDRYAITYEPALGVMKLFLNEGARELVSIKSALFAKAYFGIWLSENSVGSDFTAELLGE